MYFGKYIYIYILIFFLCDRRHIMLLFVNVIICLHRSKGTDQFQNIFKDQLVIFLINFDIPLV